MKKIDNDEAEYYLKDGKALFIRNSFPNLVEELIRATGWNIFKERDDAILIGNKEKEYFHLQQKSGELTILYINNKKVIQKWEYSRSHSSYEILNNIIKYVEE